MGTQRRTIPQTLNFELLLLLLREIQEATKQIFHLQTSSWMCNLSFLPLSAGICPCPLLDYRQTSVKDQPTSYLNVQLQTCPTCHYLLVSSPPNTHLALAPHSHHPRTLRMRPTFGFRWHSWHVRGKLFEKFGREDELIWKHCSLLASAGEILPLVCWYLPFPSHTWLWLLILAILAHRVFKSAVWILVTLVTIRKGTNRSIRMRERVHMGTLQKSECVPRLAIMKNR